MKTSELKDLIETRIGHRTFTKLIINCCGSYYEKPINVSEDISKQIGHKFEFKGIRNTVDGQPYVLFWVDGQTYRIDASRDSENYIDMWNALEFVPVTKKIVEFEVWDSNGVSLNTKDK